MLGLITVRDADNALDGVEVITTGPIDVLLCGESELLVSQAAGSVVYTCGSVIVEVLSGEVTFTFFINGQTHTLVVGAGAFATVPSTFDAEGMLKRIEITAGDGAGTVILDGEVVVPGTTSTILSTLEVIIDIKPRSDSNCFNSNGHGVIPVAILGSAAFGYYWFIPHESAGKAFSV